MQAAPCCRVRALLSPEDFGDTAGVSPCPPHGHSGSAPHEPSSTSSSGRAPAGKQRLLLLPLPFLPAQPDDIVQPRTISCFFYPCRSRNLRRQEPGFCRGCPISPPAASPSTLSAPSSAPLIWGCPKPQHPDSSRSWAAVVQKPKDAKAPLCDLHSTIKPILCQSINQLIKYLQRGHSASVFSRIF